MNNIRKYWGYALVLLLGILVGYLLKPGSDGKMVPSETGHMHETREHATEEIYTCSMHPQIRQNEPGICPICEMDLIPLDQSAMTNDDPAVLQMSPAAVKLAQIETIEVGNPAVATDREMTVKVDGVVELDERTIKSQVSHIPGIIEMLYITFEGQYVQKGQKIATLFSKDLFAISQELLTAIEFDSRIGNLKNAAVQKLRNWKIAEAQIGQIIQGKKPIDTIDIYADHSGYVLTRNLTQGDHIKEGESLYTVGSTARLWLNFNVFESDLAGVKKGNTIKFSSPSLAGQSFTSKITYIEPLLNAQTRTATVRAEINNINNTLKPGMLLTGYISSNRAENEDIIIPSSAVLWTGEKSVVYVQVEDSDIPTYEFREVTLSNQTSESAIISEGLDLGERIVVQGAFAIDAAAQLSNKASMMNRNIEIKGIEKDMNPIDYSSSIGEAFHKNLSSLAGAYLIIKNAFVATDSIAAAAAASDLLEILNGIVLETENDAARDFWQKQKDAIASHTENISENVNMEYQRSQFYFLSQALIKVLGAFGTNDHVYYVQHCPMARDNQGAEWLSSEEQIQNPYFGDKMMKCGKVTMTLSP